MKRIFASLLVVFMLVLSAQTCFAAGIFSNVGELPTEPISKELTIVAKACATGGTPVVDTNLGVINSQVGVDYEATLDMSSIRDYMGKLGDLAGNGDFQDGTIDMTINVEVVYPETAVVIGDLENDGGLTSANKDLYAESRVYDPSNRKVTVTYTIADPLTVGALITNNNNGLGNPKYLDDITFTLPNAIAYSTGGSHNVSITLTGSTVFNFTTPPKTSTINYSGNVTHTVTASTSSSSGGGRPSSYIVKFNTNGGDALDSITVKSGETVELPTPVKEGFVFDGWYTNTALTVAFDAKTEIKKNMTLFAKWIEGEEVVQPGSCNCANYTDISLDEWYHEGVEYVIENGMMNGTSETTFEPNSNVTRAMLVTVLWRAEDEPMNENESVFTDLEVDQYYVDAVEWANANGVVNGITETTFEPNTPITREQFATIVYRYAVMKGYDVSIGEDTNILSYADFDKISEYAIPAMQYAVGSGLIKGKSATTLNPADNATRAEMATILYRFIEANTAVDMDEVVE